MNVIRPISEVVQLTVPLIVAALTVALGAMGVVVIQSEYGVASVVHNGAGDYTVNLAADPGAQVAVVFGAGAGVLNWSRAGAAISVLVTDLAGAGLNAGFSLVVLATPSAP